MYHPSLRNDKNLVIFSVNKSIIDQVYKIKTIDNKKEYVKIFELDEALYRRIREINEKAEIRIDLK